MNKKELRKKRTELGYTQAELAKELGYASYHSISEMESGRRKIPKAVSLAINTLKQK